VELAVLLQLPIHLPLQEFILQLRGKRGLLEVQQAEAQTKPHQQPHFFPEAQEARVAAVALVVE
jgi:hypothetical protein